MNINAGRVAPENTQLNTPKISKHLNPDVYCLEYNSLHLIYSVVVNFDVGSTFLAFGSYSFNFFSNASINCPSRYYGGEEGTTTLILSGDINLSGDSPISSYALLGVV